MEVSKDDPVSLIFIREIDTYRRCLPYLTSVRGNGWDRKHWSQLFQILGFQTSGVGAVTVENLTLDHFLEKAAEIATHSEEIQELDSQVATQYHLFCNSIHGKSCK